jgi:chromosomal replication initiation ATPase DnaA
MESYTELKTKYREVLSNYANTLKVVRSYGIPQQLLDFIDKEADAVNIKKTQANKRPSSNSKLLQHKVREVLGLNGVWSIEEICAVFGQSVEDVLSTTRKQECVEARRFIYAYFYSIGKPYSEIGVMFGKNHATILHSVHKLVDFINWEDSATMYYLNTMRSAHEVVATQDWAELDHAL